MKNLTRTFTLIIFVVATSSLSIFAQKSNEDKKISNVVYSYEKALNSNNVDSVLQQFAKDGILVLQGAPTSIGTEAMEKFYSSIFKNIDFDLKFNIEEIVQMSPEWAFVRTTTRSNNSTDSGEGGHEIFILKKQTDGNWKIARYAGSSAK